MINMNKIIEEYLQEQFPPGTAAGSTQRITIDGVGPVIPPDGDVDGGTPPDGDGDDPDTPDTPVISFEDRVSAIRKYNNIDYQAPDVEPETGGPSTWTGGGMGFLDRYLGIKDKLVTWGFPEVSIQGSIDVVVDPGDDDQPGTDDDGTNTHIWNESETFIPGLGYWRPQGGFGPPKLP